MVQLLAGSAVGVILAVVLIGELLYRCNGLAQL